MFNWFTTRFVWIHDRKKSKQYIGPAKTVRKGFDKIVRPARTYRLVVDGEAGEFRNDVRRLRRRTITVLKNRPPATNVVVESWDEDGNRELDQVRFRKLQIAKPIPDIGVHPDLNKIYYAIFSQFRGDARNGGTYVCRFISNTHIVSRHGYRDSNRNWYGAALDVFVSRPDTMDHLWDVANFIVAETRAGNLNVARVIIANRQWTPDRGWYAYTGVYHTHVHVEVIGGVPCK